MGKKARKSKKNKVMKVDQAKRELAQETVSVSTTAEPKSDVLQEPVKPIEEKTAPVVVAAVSAEESKKIGETPKPAEKEEKKPEPQKAETKKTGETKPARKPAAKKAASTAKAKTGPKVTKDAKPKKAEDVAKPAVEKKAAAPKTAKKTPAAKAEPAKKPGRKPMTAAEKAANAKARAEEKKKADAMTPTLTMQYGGRDIDVKALVQAAKDDFKANHKRTLLTELNLYLKPEDSTLYYVANGSTEGKIKF